MKRLHKYENTRCAHTTASEYTSFVFNVTSGKRVLADYYVLVTSGWHVSCHVLLTLGGSEHASQLSQGKAWPVSTAARIPVPSPSYRRRAATVWDFHGILKNTTISQYDTIIVIIIVIIIQFQWPLKEWNKWLIQYHRKKKYFIW